MGLSKVHKKVLPLLKVVRIVPKKSIPPKKKCSIECQKRGSQKLKKKVQKMWLRKVHKKSFATFKSYENSANKVLFPKKVLKRVPKKGFQKKFKKKCRKWG